MESSYSTVDLQNIFILHNWNFLHFDQHHSPLPQCLATPILLCASMSMTVLNPTYKWEHAVFICYRFLHLAQYSPGSSMLLQMAGFHFFSGWAIFYCKYIPHLLCPFICQCLFGCFHILTVENNGAVTVEVQTSLWDLITIFFCGKYLEVGLLNHIVVLF